MFSVLRMVLLSDPQSIDQYTILYHNHRITFNVISGTYDIARRAPRIFSNKMIFFLAN